MGKPPLCHRSLTARDAMGIRACGKKCTGWHRSIETRASPRPEPSPPRSRGGASPSGADDRCTGPPRRPVDPSKHPHTQRHAMRDSMNARDSGGKKIARGCSHLQGRRRGHRRGDLRGRGRERVSHGESVTEALPSTRTPWTRARGKTCAGWRRRIETSTFPRPERPPHPLATVSEALPSSPVSGRSGHSPQGTSRGAECDPQNAPVASVVGVPRAERPSMRCKKIWMTSAKATVARSMQTLAGLQAPDA